MKLLLVCLDGVRVDLALPQAVAADPQFARPDLPSDPRFSSGGADHTMRLDESAQHLDLAPTLNRLAHDDGHSHGRIIPVWMTPPTDSAPGWSSLLTGSTHEQCNVWWNEFVGHELAKRPDILSRVFFANPAAATMVAATWDAFVTVPGPIIQRRVDQQRTGQHQVFSPDLSRGLAAADAEVAQWANWKLLHEGPDAAVVYFEQVDAAGHEYGAESKQYRQAIRDVDELTRHLVKAVAERHEQLGEDWLVAVLTDHGHKPEGGHGEDEIEVRRSFLIVHRIGQRLPAPLIEVGALRPEHVMWQLLAALGIQQGNWDAPRVGESPNIEPIGPTRDPRLEW